MESIKVYKKKHRKAEFRALKPNMNIVYDRLS